MVSEAIRKRDREYCRKWYEKNKEHYRVKKRAYYWRNRDHMQQYSRDYAANHREQKREYFLVWSKKPEAMAAHAAHESRRRAQKRGSKIDTDKDAVRAVYIRAACANKIRCYLCEKIIPRGQRCVDHVVPLIHGGEHRSSNLAIACASCNSSKNAKMPEELGLLL